MSEQADDARQAIDTGQVDAAECGSAAMPTTAMRSTRP